ncbi:MAG: NAD-dependent epimerase/dehydratase family protein [Gemmatimonadetes bacterium]|nr:NAD-dependent epimerase/dehydratase family protein [Gemmatimonadota bacterium]
MARALVIGGTSLIGRPLVRTLLEGGHDVTIMHRSPGTPFGDRVREVHADRNDPDAVASAVEGHAFDWVFDNVYDWARGTTGEQVAGTVTAVAPGLERYVYMSSVAVYPEGGPWDESAEMVPGTDPNMYAAQKADGERAVFAYAAQTGLAVSTVRPAFVYGPHNPFDREAFFWDRLLAKRPILIPGDGTRVMQWVHTDDVARASVAAASMDAGAGEAFNLAGPPVTQRQFVEILAEVAGVEADLVPVARETLVAAGGQLLEPPLYFGAYLDVPPLTVTGDKLRDRLGVEVLSLREGMAQTFAWYRDQGRPAPDTSWEDGVLRSVRGG